MDHRLQSETETLPDGFTMRVMFCKVCGGTPGKRFGTVEISRTLTSECSGVTLTSEQQYDVIEGKIDFKNGAWINL